MEYKWVALTVTTVGTFMSGLNNSIVTIGLPTVLQDLNTTMVNGVWIITGYRLMMTILLVVLGRIADMYGRVRLYNIGFVIFTVGSLICSFSASGEQLVLFRLFQGVGGALLIANSAAIITDAFPRNQLGTGLGINMMAVNIASALGYTVSGVMIQLFGWRSLFLINVPVGIFGTVWAYKRLKEISRRKTEEKFDFTGASLYCTGLAIVLYSLTFGNLLSMQNLLLLTAGLSLFPILILVERRVKFPTIDLTLFKIRAFAAGNVTSFLNTLAFNCVPFLISLYLQLVLGYDPVLAGLLLIPMSLVVLVMSPITGMLSDRLGSRGISSAGLAVNAVSLAWFSALNINSTYYSIIISLVLFGIGRGLFSSPNVSAIMGSVPASRRGVANGVRSALVQTGNVLSIPLAMIFMSTVISYDKLSTLVSSSQLTSSGELLIFQAALSRTFLILSIIMVVALIPSLLRGKRTEQESTAEQTDRKTH
ncbi:MAG: hypothetical protein QG670_1008 [Thermoproteota archaeon]|nr:hypothetical protein [Thermoproteota archaeon]